jgi:hypothetical protein
MMSFVKTKGGHRQPILDLFAWIEFKEIGAEDGNTQAQIAFGAAEIVALVGQGDWHGFGIIGEGRKVSLVSFVFGLARPIVSYRTHDCDDAFGSRTTDQVG